MVRTRDGGQQGSALGARQLKRCCEQGYGVFAWGQTLAALQGANRSAAHVSALGQRLLCQASLKTVLPE
jgi:hypothetical protein